jgi:hypothetical protein
MYSLLLVQFVGGPMPLPVASQTALLLATWDAVPQVSSHFTWTLHCPEEQLCRASLLRAHEMKR